MIQQPKTKWNGLLWFMSLPALLSKRDADTLWNEDGCLANDLILRSSALTSSMLVKGPRLRRTESWDRPIRKLQAANLLKRFAALEKVGVHELVLSGGFVERIASPDGVSGYFICPEVPATEFCQRLELVDPALNWDWNPSLGGRLAMWHTDMVELWPVYPVPGAPAGLMFTVPPEYFHNNRETGRPKGCLKLRMH